MAPAKKKVINKAKVKYNVNTAQSQTNLDNNENTNSVNSDDILADIESTNNTFNLDNIDNETLRSLKLLITNHLQAQTRCFYQCTVEK